MRGGKRHGPYWYGYYRDARTGKVRSVYIGKKLPRGEQRDDAPRESRPVEVPDQFAWDGRRMSVLTAMRVLGVKSDTPKLVKDAFRKLIARYHPDKARNDSDRLRFAEISKAINVAKQTLLSGGGFRL